MMIFVEGVDGSGKTTLIEQLSNQYISLRVPRVADFEFWQSLICRSKGLNILVDRSPMSEYVYRQFDGEVCKFSYDQLRHLLKQSKTIICESDTAFKDSMNRGEDNITDVVSSNRLKYLYSVIGQSLVADGVDIIKYNWRFDSPDDVINFIEGGNNNESGTL